MVLYLSRLASWITHQSHLLNRNQSPCSAELIRTAYQPWNSVFLSQQNSHSRLISRKNSLPNRVNGSTARSVTSVSQWRRPHVSLTMVHRRSIRLACIVSHFSTTAHATLGHKGQLLHWYKRFPCKTQQGITGYMASRHFYNKDR
jgi:hypothetical protein